MQFWCFIILIAFFLDFIKSQHPESQEIPKNESHRDFVIKNLLPSKRFCGKQHTDDYFYNEADTSVDEFPWMVYIPFYADFKTEGILRGKTGCVGFLVSNRYILTEKNCMEIAVSRNRFVVLIGQHHIYKDVNCIKTSFGEDDCTIPSVETTIADSFQRNNIVLVRLDKSLRYTDFIRPICLPLDESDRPSEDEIIVTSGWGEQQVIDGNDIKIKKRIKHTLMSSKDCEDDNPIVNPICGITFPNSSESICTGDSGGPMMFHRRRRNWVAQGIITANVVCDKRQPAVGEQLTPETVEWIIDNIQP